MKFPESLASEFLHMNWLRPENVVWATKAATLLNEYFPRNPSLDLGSGNGLSMFTAAGGKFSWEYDWYINTNTSGFLNNKDIYDSYTGVPIERYITPPPRKTIRVAFDHKPNLLEQAKKLGGFYRETKQGDANAPLPFTDEMFLDVYSNILYWLKSPKNAVKEIYRIIRPGGRFITCVPRKKFFEYCDSYRYETSGKYERILKLVNRGRKDSHQWAVVDEAFEQICLKTGFKKINKENYLSSETLKIWDYGFRPFSPALIKMANSLSEGKRVEVKKEWCQIAMVYIRELWELENSVDSVNCGFSFMVFEKG